MQEYLEFIKAGTTRANSGICVENVNGEREESEKNSFEICWRPIYPEKNHDILGLLTL